MTQPKQNYEAMVILSSQLSEEERDAIIAKLAKILTDGGAEIKETARWGKRRLGYPIQKKTDGFYVIFYFHYDGGAEMLNQFERTCRYDENILRQMTLKVPTHKRGQAIAQIVPSPGWMADFRLEPRSSMPRRRFDSAPAGAPRDEAPRESAVEVEAPADEPGE